ncbi:MAG: hypothetical protein QM791_20590 [Ferruginibacter sp.]
MIKRFSWLITFCFSFHAAFTQSADFRIYNTTSTSVFTGNNFKTIAVGKEGNIWAGTQYQGLYKYNPFLNQWDKCPDLTNVFINDIKADKNGGIWVAQSGTSGQSGGATNIAGGVNYFPNPVFIVNNYYSFATGGGLTTRNVRSLWIDTNRVNVLATLPRVWAAQATFITSGNTAAGGISAGLNEYQDYFYKVTKGLQVFPYVNQASAGTPSCDAIGGNKDELWVATRQNFGRSQILRYHPLNIQGTFLGAYDYTNTPALSNTFRANALYFDNEDRQWVGLNFGGIVVKSGSVWKTVNMDDLLPSGIVINNNAITGDDAGNIYIGTSNGLLVYEGGPVDVSSSYTKYTAADGLPSNNITGVAADNANGRILLATDNGIVFWQKSKRIDAKLIWDNSFPAAGGKPKGVAADGVSRLYIKVKRGNDTIPAFKKVELILPNFNAGNATLKGRVRTADTLKLNAYSNEANSGTVLETSRTDSTVKGEFWFWYVSPEDFCLSETSNEALLEERKDTVKIRVTFKNDTKDSVNLLVRVVRPPMIMVHGLASSPAAWDSVKYNETTSLLQSNLFKQRHALKIGPRSAFIENAILLLGADVAIGSGANKLNTIQGNIEAIRTMGFAANQVDFVCHSMGGSAGRSAPRFRPDKYYADGNYMYNNYGKGFMHKMILVNSPHHGSPIPDATEEFLPSAPAPVNLLLEQLYNARHEEMYFDFVAPDYKNGAVYFRGSPAVINLQVSPSKGGIRHLATDVKYHIIAGDVDWLSSSTASTLASADSYVSILNTILTVARDLSPEPQRGVLTGFLALGKAARALTFAEWYSQRKGFPNFLGDGDLIVPLGSQTARLAVNAPNVTLFKNSPGASMDAWHSGILSRLDVGKRIFALLNTKRSSDLFANQIPPNLDPDPNTSARPAATLAVTSSFDTTKIALWLPQRNGSTYADSNITVRLRLKDTAGLAYIRISFQGNDTFNFGRNPVQQFNIKASPYLTGRQTLWVMAIYDKANETKYYVDTLGINVSNLAALQGFRAVNDHAELESGTAFKPAFEVQYNNQWVPLANNDLSIQVAFDTAGIVEYDAATASFNALKNGFVQATVSYKGFVATINLTSTLSLFNNCINRTIAGGSFKDPLIWSKGMVPGVCDSVVIQAGHAVVADSSLKTASIRINSGGTFSITNAAVKIECGEKDQATSMIDNYGTLNISNGNIIINGRLKLNTGSTYNMTGGTIIINSNTGEQYTSLASGNACFEAATGMTKFSFTGGSLQITDPPLNAPVQSINCPYDFGDNTTLILGDGSSVKTSNNTNGFGSEQFPNKIGRLIINATIRTGNRQFINKKALSVKGSVEVKSGSGMVLQAPLNVNK